MGEAEIGKVSEEHSRGCRCVDLCVPLFEFTSGCVGSCYTELILGKEGLL